ncbi:hypothetical protein BGX34_004617 [Mortierella sp. NVP85]|nr:hypothetical protein BGX34_004617 [Mortierella sp. NVP85]
MSARRFADVQALVAVGANVSQRFLALELRQLKQYAATSSLLKRSNNRTESNSSSTTISGTVSPTTTAAPLSSNLSQLGELSASEPQKVASVTGTWIDNIFTSIPLKATLSPSSSSTVSISSTVPSGAQVTAAEEPSLLDPSFLATPAAHGYKRPTVATVTPQQHTPLKKEEQINRDALETLLRESKWLDGLPAEDETQLNKGAADQTSLWAQRERLGPRIFVYESLRDNIEEGSEDEKHRYQNLESTATSRTGTTETVYRASTPAPPTTTTYAASSSIPSVTATVLPTVDTVPTLETTKSIPDAEPSVSYNMLTGDDGTVSGESPKKTLTEAAMPTSRVGRLFHYGTLAASLGVGAFTETVRRSVGRGTVSSESPMFLTPANMDRLVNKLTKMRGAALKLGQMLSIQDNKMLPAELEEVLLRVQNSANFMPEKQMRKVMSQTMGSNWESEFTDFGMIPIAAASIGQVHKAIHRATGMPVAVKVQYPGVAASIDSDLSNLKTLVLMSSILPRGMYLDNTLKVAQRELGWETDYLREADCIEEFGRLLQDDPDYQVPRLVREASGPMVLTMEWMPGETMNQVMQMREQSVRDRIGTNILSLCLKELFEYQYMQTDPNWTNFLYNPTTTKLELLDFGATRGFDSRFTTLYLKTILAGAAGDRDGCLKYSRELGFLTGEETEVMETAHINSLLTLAEPFQESAPDVYDFKYQTITQRVKDQIPTMLKYRLTPPPDETYSMHRKMAGAFLLCSKLGARVECKKLFREITSRYREDQVDERRGANFGRGE